MHLLAKSKAYVNSEETIDHFRRRYMVIIVIIIISCEYSEGASSNPGEIIVLNFVHFFFFFVF